MTRRETRGFTLLALLLVAAPLAARKPRPARPASAPPAAGQPARSLPPEVVLQTGHLGLNHEVVFSPDGSLLASGGSMDKSVLLWDLRTGLQLRALVGHRSEVQAVAFSPDGSRLASAAIDGDVRLWNLADGTCLRTLRPEPGAFSPQALSVAFRPDGLVIASSLGGEVFLWNAATGTAIKRLGDRHSHQITNLLFTSDGDRLVSVDQGHTAVIWDARTGDFKAVIDRPPGGNLAGAAVDRAGRILALVEHTKGDPIQTTITLWDLATGAAAGSFPAAHRPGYGGLAFSPDGATLHDGYSSFALPAGLEHRREPEARRVESRVSLSPDGRLAAVGGSDSTGNGILLYDARSGQQVGLLTSKMSPVNDLAFAAGKVAVAFWGGVELFDLGLGALRAFPGDYSKVALSPDGSLLAAGTGSGSSNSAERVDVWEVASGKKLRDFALGGDRYVDFVGFTRDGTRLVTKANQTDRAAVWDLKTGVLLRHVALGPEDLLLVLPANRRPSHVEEPQDDDPLDLELAGMFKTRDEVRGFSLDGLHLLARRPDRAGLDWVDRHTGETLKTIPLEGEVQSQLAAGGAALIACGGKRRPDGGYDQGRCLRIDLGTGETLADFPAAYPGLASEDGRLIAVQPWSFGVELRDGKTGALVAQLAAIREEGLIVTPEGTYLSPGTSAARAIAFRLQGRAYSFAQFDVKFNRPDLVLARLGFAAPARIDAFHRAYQRRLRRLGFREEEVAGTELQLPELKLAGEPIPLTTAERVLRFTVEASDARFPLNRIDVSVNDVPAFGAAGLPLPGAKKNARRQVELRLSAGPNSIEVSVLNSQGVESLRTRFKVALEVAAKPELYFVGIGVSDYGRPAVNLAYAAKDATDLAAMLQKAGGPAAHVLTLLDRDATRERVLEARALLEKATEDDTVVLFAAGHGLLDDKLDYYFGTTDIDFDQPSLRGLPYEALEGLLDGLRARRKLLLMDTCNSGELDKEGAQKVASAEPPDPRVKARSVNARGLKVIASQSGLVGLPAALGELFADLRRSSGAVVISSASGTQFALESDEWHNGVFTYALLDALQEQHADKDHDGHVQMSELREFVVDEVKALTQGRQTPTSRRDNLSDDFQLF